jgi:hypothetical protein
MKIANKPLNWQAIAIEEAETQIRLIVKNEYLKGTPKAKISEKVLKVISALQGKLKYPELKEASRISLMQFAERQYREISRIKGEKLLVLLACLKLTDRNNEIVKNLSVSKAQGIIKSYAPPFYNINPSSATYATEMRKFTQDYIKDNVKPVFDRLSKQYPFDPASIPSGQTIDHARNTHINSLRNRAELEVRYNGHLENIKNLKEQGNKLVIASSHADCSERCAKLQGRVYSLDGTYGVTPDGRKFEPLENATDVYYTTKAGKVWKNGLLGFNCRHYLVAYKDGFRFPKPNVAEERKQYAITEEQRHLERNVRYWRTRAIYEKGIDKKAYNKAREKAISWNEKYIEFSHSNGRAYYPSRTKII